MSEILIATASSVARAIPVSGQRLVNCYAEAQPRDAKTPVAVFGSPGIKTFGTAGDGPVRGLFEMGGVGYAVSGETFYSFTSAGTTTSRGSGIGGQGVVSMAGNGTEIAIVNGSNGWIYTPATTTLTEITDPDFNPANSVAYLGGYFCFDEIDTNRFFLSDLLDGFAYPALYFASAETHPDYVMSVINNHGVLLLMGEKTIEPWDHTGALAFPFQRFAGSTPARGIAAPLAFAKEDNTVFFLGDDRVFYRLAGISPMRVSTHAQEIAWERYTTVDDAFCFSWGHGGHKFVVLTFPTELKTWVLDVATGLWHERSSYDNTGIEARWRGNCSVSIFGKTLIGDQNSGVIGEIDDDTYTEFGNTIRMSMVFPPVHGQGKRVSMPHFELDVEAGVGLTTGQGSDPQYMFDYSDDGGRTYTIPQIWQSAGKIGEYKKRLHWRRLGSFDQRTMRVQITDPVKRTVIAARCPGLAVGL